MSEIHRDYDNLLNQNYKIFYLSPYIPRCHYSTRILVESSRYFFPWLPDVGTKREYSRDQCTWYHWTQKIGLDCNIFVIVQLKLVWKLIQRAGSLRHVVRWRLDSDLRGAVMTYNAIALMFWHNQALAVCLHRAVNVYIPFPMHNF